MASAALRHEHRASTRAPPQFESTAHHRDHRPPWDSHPPPRARAPRLDESAHTQREHRSPLRWSLTAGPRDGHPPPRARAPALDESPRTEREHRSPFEMVGDGGTAPLATSAGHRQEPRTGRERRSLSRSPLTVGRSPDRASTRPRRAPSTGESACPERERCSQSRALPPKWGEPPDHRAGRPEANAANLRRKPAPDEGGVRAAAPAIREGGKTPNWRRERRQSGGENGRENGTREQGRRNGT